MTDQPLLPFERMTRYVHRAIAEHPELEPIRQARKPIVVHAHERAIFATTLREVDGNGWRIEVRIERPTWWEPVSRAHGDELVEELAAGVRERWEAKKSRPIRADNFMKET